MKKLKLYLDTSVISHLYAPDTPEKTADTLQLWEDIKIGLYDVHISNITLDEIYASPTEKADIMIEYLSEINYTTISINDEMRVI